MTVKLIYICVLGVATAIMALLRICHKQQSPVPPESI